MYCIVSYNIYSNAVEQRRAFLTLIRRSACLVAKTAIRAHDLGLVWDSNQDYRLKRHIMGCFFFYFILFFFLPGLDGRPHHGPDESPIQV